MVPNQEHRSVSAAAVPGNGSYMHAHIHIHTQCSLSCTQTTINNNHQYIVTRLGEARLPSPMPTVVSLAPGHCSHLISSRTLASCCMGATLEKYWCWWTGSSVTVTDSRLQGVLRLSRRTVGSTDTPLHQQPRAGWRNARHRRRTFKNKLPDMTASYKQLDRGTYRHRTRCHSSVMRHGLLTLRMKPTHWAPYNASR